MTRSFHLHRRVPTLTAPSLGLLLGLALAATGCGGAGDASATSSAPAAAPAGPDASAATPLAAPAAASGATATGVATSSLPPTTVRAASTAPSTSSPPTSSRPSTSPPYTTTTGGDAAGQRLTGTVTASPTCPVERPDQPCSPRPVAGAHVEVFDQAERLVTSADADAEGRFSLTVAPGRYVLTVGSGGVLPSCPPLTVDVPAAGTAQADIACDTGIR